MFALWITVVESNCYSNILYLSTILRSLIYILFHFILLLHWNSEGNIVLFTPLHLQVQIINKNSIKHPAAHQNNQSPAY